MKNDAGRAGTTTVATSLLSFASWWSSRAIPFFFFVVVVVVVVPPTPINAFASWWSNGARSRTVSLRRDESVATAVDHHHVDPLLLDVALFGTEDGDDDDDDRRRLRLGGLSLASASAGLRAWRTALRRGRVPLPEIDFASDDDVWPPEPLFSVLDDTVTELELPRLVWRWPVLVDAVLRAVLRTAVRYVERAAEWEETQEEKTPQSNDHNDDHERREPSTLSSLENLALDAVTDCVMEPFDDVVSGVSLLDRSFGSVASGDLVEGLLKDFGNGVGSEVGVWKHTGWRVLPDLQRRVASLPRLRALISSLGRRPTAKGGASPRLFPLRRLDKRGSLGACRDPVAVDSTEGLTLSDEIATVLPSETVLLANPDPSSRRTTEVLFLSKLAERRLLSHERSGWTDASSSPARRRRRRRAPTSRDGGGPLIVCLDASWSMSTTTREHLSKAVVLECARACRARRRVCRVVSFSNEDGVEVLDLDPNHGDGHGDGDDYLTRLLDFLGKSFEGGGTDVTGALKRALEYLEEVGGDAEAADLLLVTDGEIPDPPVNEETADRLQWLITKRGVEIHGLSVGERESAPLGKLCTHVHDFLMGYDDFDVVGRWGESRSDRGGGTALYSSSLPRSSSFEPFRLRSRRRVDTSLRAKQRRRANKWDDDHYEENDDLLYDDNDNEDHSNDVTFTKTKGRKNKKADRRDKSDTTDEYSDRVAQTLDSLRVSVKSVVEREAWSDDELTKERETLERTVPGYDFDELRVRLSAAVDRLSRGLVERDGEARLVVLSALASEHVLLVGAPGTGKSVLGRRLSTLFSERTFFSRLLTRFTTPEELFGPLSLRALSERDEYVRRTKGYLPTASVAFLDEIFKANAAVLNALLTILNERRFDNGSDVEECPLRCAVGASNELPDVENDGEELSALYDRFLIRREVTAVSDEGLRELLSESDRSGLGGDDDDDDDNEDNEDNEVDDTVRLDDVVDVLSRAADEVAVDPIVLDVLVDLRTFCREELNVRVSDRRLVKATRLLRIVAAAQGRARVDPVDCCALLPEVSWERPEQRDAVRDRAWDRATPSGDPGALDRLAGLLDVLRADALATLKRTSGDVDGTGGARPADAAAVRRIADETADAANVLRGLRAATERHAVLCDADHAWFDPDERRAYQRLARPRAERDAERARRTLSRALALERCLRTTSAGGVTIDDDVRLSVVEGLWGDDDDDDDDDAFTDDELNMDMRDAKAKYDLDTFRKWKRARKKKSNRQ